MCAIDFPVHLIFWSGHDLIISWWCFIYHDLFFFGTLFLYQAVLKDGSPSDATSCISSLGDATSSVKESDVDQESFWTEQGIYYVGSNYPGYHYQGLLLWYLIQCVLIWKRDVVSNPMEACIQVMIVPLGNGSTSLTTMEVMDWIFNIL